MVNGYIVEVKGVVYGPYITFKEAESRHKGNDRSIRALQGNAFTVNVIDCDRSECRHCRSIEREAAKANG